MHLTNAPIDMTPDEVRDFRTRLESIPEPETKAEPLPKPSRRAGLTDAQLAELLAARAARQSAERELEALRVTQSAAKGLHHFRDDDGEWEPATAPACEEPAAKWWRLFVAFAGCAMLGILLLSLFGDAVGSDWCAAMAIVMIGSAITGMALLMIAFFSEWRAARR